ncbi:MAG: SDR family NAD(P)-dependent oxidoreductase [Betaproteobacteria bacterium]|nr:SDR family NAD(P)-dependent oxidoreductase [Betaproteobacteria bacterium]
MNNALLEGRVALVTGGARGIGLAIVRAFVQQGARVLVADSGASISGVDADPAVTESACRELGDRVVPFVDDISQPGAAERAVATALESFGALDIVVNNAAILRDGFIFKSRREDWQRVLEVNLHGPFAVLAAATPAMRDAVKQGRAPGRILNVVSTAGIVGNLGQSAYASAKAGLIGLTRVTAMDLARAGIACNALAPFAATRVTDAIQPANDGQAQYKTRALAIPPAYVARLATWLCSSASGFTGQILGVRGREIFLFGQARPVARVAADVLERQDALALGGVLETEFANSLTDLTTDLELFNTEPLL